MSAAHPHFAFELRHNLDLLGDNALAVSDMLLGLRQMPQERERLEREQSARLAVYAPCGGSHPG